MGLSFPVTASVSRPGETALLVGMLALASLIVLRHRPNLVRLLRGEEPRVGATPSEPSPRS